LRESWSSWPASFCLLFTQSHPGPTRERLKIFCREHNGLKLAELDLQRRGAGDLFGTAQSGYDELEFASWTNLTLINQAREFHHLISTKEIDWQPVFAHHQILGQVGKLSPICLMQLLVSFWYMMEI
jgi:RecG-like helicase